VEAGATVGGLRGALAGNDLAIGAPGSLFDDLAALLESVGADSDEDPTG
jgi:myo-inositol-1(or 4)-monophosphatase